MIPYSHDVFGFTITRQVIGRFVQSTKINGTSEYEANIYYLITILNTS